MSGLGDYFTLPVILGCIAVVIFLIGLIELIRIGMGHGQNERSLPSSSAPN